MGDADSEGQGQGEGQGDGSASSSSSPGEGAVTRAEFSGLEGKVDRVLELLGKGEGQGQGEGEAAGKSIAEQVREGIEELRAKEAAQARADSEKAEREDHARRLAALEEKPPGTPETWLNRVQRRLYGQEPDGTATPRPQRQRQGAAK